jgi:hypothetical protein
MEKSIINLAVAVAAENYLSLIYDNRFQVARDLEAGEDFIDLAVRLSETVVRA